MTRNERVEAAVTAGALILIAALATAPIWVQWTAIGVAGVLFLAGVLRGLS